MARRSGDSSGQPRLTGVERAALAVLGAGLLVIPTIYCNGLDVFRLPKELVFRAEAVLLLALAAFWATARRRTWTLGWRPEFVVAGTVVCWAVVTTISSTNRQLSLDSLMTVLAAVVIFVATCVAAQTTSIIAIDVLMAACCTNGVIVVLQELKIWSPFPSSATLGGHYSSIALLGNANDVGTFLVTPAIGAVVMSVTASGARRWIYAGVCVLLVAGIAASATRTALGALVAALFVFAAGRSRRSALAAAGVLLILALVVLSPATSIGRGVRDLADAATKRDYERLFSERLLPFLAAIDMTRDHPLLGVGPGCFKYHYMAYNVALQHRYPKEWTRGWPMNWGEVHNDHLQVAAEAGLPGYALFIAAISVIIWVPRRRMIAATPEGNFARVLRWPLAVAVFVICLAQFPLELAAPRPMLITLAGLCLTWDRLARSATVGVVSADGFAPSARS